MTARVLAAALLGAVLLGAALLGAPLLSAPTAGAARPGGTPGAVPGQPWGAAAGARGSARVQDLAPRVDDLAPRVEDLVTRQVGTTSIVLGTDVLFAFGSADLPGGTGDRLTGVLGAIRAGGVGSVRVEGHTDGIGTPQDNQVLSERRAASVDAALRAALGASAPPITSAGFGETRPLGPEVVGGEDDPAARAADRRVEVILQS